MLRNSIAALIWLVGTTLMLVGCESSESQPTSSSTQSEGTYNYAFPQTLADTSVQVEMVDVLYETTLGSGNYSFKACPDGGDRCHRIILLVSRNVYNPMLKILFPSTPVRISGSFQKTQHTDDFIYWMGIINEEVFGEVIYEGKRSDIGMPTEVFHAFKLCSEAAPACHLLLLREGAENLPPEIESLEVGQKVWLRGTPAELKKEGVTGYYEMMGRVLLELE
jgi:hypothetical protein